MVVTGCFSAAYVPPDGFLARSWFLPVRSGVPWYYHAPRQAGAQNVALDSTLDPPLVPLVLWARREGLITGPSCAGHTVAPGAAAAVWQGLLADAAAIRGVGLVLVDVETAQRWRWRALDYRLPYPSADGLDRDLRAHERAGLLPLRGQAAVLREVGRAAQRVPWVTAEIAGRWLKLRVRAPSEAAQRATWGALAVGLGAT